MIEPLGPLPSTASTPPADLLQVISEAVAVYVAAKAAGKDWYRSKGLWGAAGSLVFGIATAVLPAIDAPKSAYIVTGALTVLAAGLAGLGRATASGPLR
jgi:hypothetical protein